MDKNTLIGILIINILFLFVPLYVNAKTVTGVGEYEFGADITENQSCTSAKVKAEADAIERAFGSTVGAIDWEMCDNNTCDFNSLSWSDTFGQVTEVFSETKILLQNPRRCRVTLTAEVKAIKTISPTFDIDVALNRSTYRSEDEMTVKIEPSEPMYIAVFTWSPGYDVGLIELMKIKEDITLPRGDVRWLVRSEQNTPSKEMIFVIATKHEIGFLANYPTNKFKKMVQQLMISGSIVRKISYTVDPQ